MKFDVYFVLIDCPTMHGLIVNRVSPILNCSPLVIFVELWVLEDLEFHLLDTLIKFVISLCVPLGYFHRFLPIALCEKILKVLVFHFGISRNEHIEILSDLF